jgi:hypothetical protein
MPAKEDQKFWTPQFMLVWTMLLVLLILILVILFTSPSAQADFEQVADYRKNMLSIILAAFGAWVGAGLAYFFGKDNLRVAMEGILSMRDQSPQERLRKTPIRQVPPKPIDWTVKVGEPLATVVQKLKSEPERWFIPILKEDGKLETLIHEQAVWRFIDQQCEAGTPYVDALKKNMSDVLTYVKATSGLEKDLNIYVVVGMDQSTGEAYDLMQSRKVYIAIVLDEKGMPKQYIDTADVRNLLLKTGMP